MAGSFTLPTASSDKHMGNSSEPWHSRVAGPMRHRRGKHGFTLLQGHLRLSGCLFVLRRMACALSTNYYAVLCAGGWALAAWKQVLKEAGSIIPNRNIERQLRRTHIPVPHDDQRRIDIIAPCLNVALGLPLFCDVTVISPITGNGNARSGTSNSGGRLLELAERENNDTYREVVSSGLD